MNHRQIEIFRALMLTGSVTKTAELLHTSQPTISRELARLETTLQLVLFLRAKGKLWPTQTALSLYSEVQQSYIGLERIMATAQHLRKKEGASIAIIAQPLFTQVLLPAACKSISKTLKNISIHIDSQESPFLDTRLSSQNYDLGISEHTQAPEGTRLIPLLSIDEVCILPNKHPLLKKDKLSLQDFEGFDYISFDQSDTYRIQLDQLFTQHQVNRNLVVETTNSVSVCNFVKQNMGIAIINPLSALAFASKDMHIRALDFSCPFTISLITPLHRPANPISELFIKTLQSQALLIKKQLEENIKQQAHQN